MSANSDKIALLNSAKSSKNLRLSEIVPKESYLRGFEKIVCPTGTTGNPCRLLNANKVGEANVLLAEITRLKSEIQAIDTEIGVLIEADRANNQANVSLANKGISMEALALAAKGQNEAAAIKAAAEAEAIKTTATTQADNSRNNNMVFIAVAVVVVAVVAFVLFKKFKKKK
jgi:hypothetical protein